MNETTDLELMSQVQQGDTAKMGTLFERHHARIYTFCRHMTSSRQAGEDLVQEVFLRALKYRRTFRGDSQLLTWLYRLARNVCHDYFRTARRHPLAEAEHREEASREPDAAQQLEHQEQLDLLHRALERLPLERREVLILSRFERRRYGEIAQLLGCSEGAVKVRVHRALRHLRTIYQTLQNGAVS